MNDIQVSAKDFMELAKLHEKARNLSEEIIKCSPKELLDKDELLKEQKGCIVDLVLKELSMHMDIQDELIEKASARRKEIQKLKKLWEGD